MGPFPSLAARATIADPYPVYRRLRDEDPVHWDEEFQTWVLTRYSDIEAALRNSHLSSQHALTIRNIASPEVPETTRSSLAATLQKWILFLDPPDHTRLRGLVSKAFTPRVVENLRTHIEGVVHELLAAAGPAGRLDVIREFAYPLPAIVIAELLGVRREDRDLVKRWSDALALLLGSSDVKPNVAEDGARSLEEFGSYLRDIIAERKRQPRPDLISGLLQAEEEGSLLSYDELVANCALLLFAGHETTTNLIGNGTLALLRHPEQLARLRVDASLIKTAIEELLRFDSPVQATSRLVKEDIEIGGRVIRKDQTVLLLLGSANRDPAQFPDPDSLDLARINNHHGAFAFGPHYCLGAPLARLEAQIAFPALFNAFPDLQLAKSEIEWRANFVLRGLKSLPLGFASRATVATA